MTEPHSPRVALLIDGDNLSHAHAGAVILAAARHGALTIKRVYGNMATHPGWDEAPGFRCLHSGRGKNAADLALAVDAMGVMLTGQADILAIASSDGDFSHLALHLVERGHRVIGLGQAKTPEHFRKSCTTFHLLDEAKPKKVAAPPPPSPPLLPPAPVAPASPEDPMVQTVRNLLQQTPEGLAISHVSARMSKEKAVQIRQTQWKTWRAFLIARPDIFLCDPKGPQAKVRLRP